MFIHSPYRQSHENIRIGDNPTKWKNHLLPFAPNMATVPEILHPIHAFQPIYSIKTSYTHLFLHNFSSTLFTLSFHLSHRNLMIIKKNVVFPSDPTNTFLIPVDFLSDYIVQTHRYCFSLLIQTWKPFYSIFHLYLAQ